MLFMTGFAESEAAISAGILDDRMQIIIKPFPMETMAGRVAAMFESPARPDNGV